MKRLLIALVVSVALVMGAAVPQVTAAGENSTPSSWAEEEIERAKEHNLVTDKVLTGFQQDINREEFCELAVKLYEALSGDGAQLPETNKFTDTDNPEILKANNMGIVQGVGEDRFAPFNSITREQIAVMLHRTIAAANTHLIDGIYPVTFSDKGDISSWAEEAVGFMNEKDILTGVGQNRVSPRGNTTREQAIALVIRTFDKFEDAGYTPLALDDVENILLVPADYSTIQAAIDAAGDGDAVLVAPGAYEENINFAGKNIVVTSEKGPEETVVNGGFEGSVVTIHSEEGRDAVLHGFTITNGMSGFSGAEMSPNLYPRGGGISIREASPTIAHNVITKNAAVDFGGGISVEGESARPLIENNRFHQNITHYQGAGIAILEGATPTVRGNVIYDNRCESGPGILVAGSSGGLIEENTIRDNVHGYDHDPHLIIQYLKDDPAYYRWAEDWGQHTAFPGGIQITQQSDPVVRNNWITENDGGGIGVMLGSTPLIEGNTITNNSNEDTGAVTGGIMAAHDARPILTGNTLTGNLGPAIWVDRRNSEFVDANGRVLNLEDNDVGDNTVSGETVAWPLERPEPQISDNPQTLWVPQDYTTIQDAIDSARHGDTVVVAPGIYNESIDFRGHHITVRSEDHLDESIVENTVINGGDPNAPYDGQGPIVMFINGEGRGAVLEGFTIHNRDRDFFNMSAFYISGASPTIRNNIITSDRGTGVLLNWAYTKLYKPDQQADEGRFTPQLGMETAPLLKNNIIRDCTVGGGMWFYYASPEIIGNKFINNEGPLSGAIHNWFSNAIIKDNEFIGNMGHNGGALHFENFATVHIENNLFQDNVVQGLGGAVYIDSPTYGTIAGNVFTGNSARPGSAVALNFAADIELTNNVFAENYGWALYVGGSRARLTNNTFANNYKAEGETNIEGIFVMDGEVVGVNNIFYNSDLNVWEGEGGGDISVTNSLFYNDENRMWPGDGNEFADPLFVGDGDYQLRSGSPAIDAGVTVDLEVDIIGTPRPQGRGFDIGAYETVSP